MSKRTLTVLRFNGMQFTFTEAIGSPELDAKLQTVWDGYLRLQGCEVVLAAGVNTIKEIPEDYQNKVFSNQGIGLIPILVLWMEKSSAANDAPEADGMFYPNIFHSAPAFIGRIEVEEKLTPLRLV